MVMLENWQNAALKLGIDLEEEGLTNPIGALKEECTCAYRECKEQESKQTPGGLKEDRGIGLRDQRAWKMETKSI